MPRPPADSGSGPPPGRPEEARRRPAAGIRLATLEQLEVEIEKLVTGGEGLGRFEGIPIFVPRAAPGDRLRVRLMERRPDYGRGEIVEILRPGPGRRDAPCPHFARCGGCDLQHLDDALQTRLKAEAVRETLQRLGKVEVPARIRVRAASPWGYRLRTQLQIAAGEDGVQVGYFSRRSHKLVPVDSCPVLVEDLAALLPRLPRELPETPPRRLDLTVGDGGTVSVAPVVDGLPHGEVIRTVGDFTYGLDARCFFQGHRELLLALVEEVVGEGEGETAVDLYAGVGLFSLPLARRYRRVVAVESDRVATRYARKNARRNRLGNVEVVSSAVESALPSLPSEVDRVVADPPRSGLSRKVRQWLADTAPAEITYASCHPAAMARDLRFLSRTFGLEGLAVLDLFPQTGHIEVVARLRRLES